MEVEDFVFFVVMLFMSLTIMFVPFATMGAWEIEQVAAALGLTAMILLLGKLNNRLLLSVEAVTSAGVIFSMQFVGGENGWLGLIIALLGFAMLCFIPDPKQSNP